MKMSGLASLIVAVALLGSSLWTPAAQAQRAAERDADEFLSKLVQENAAADAKAREVKLSFTAPRPGLATAGIFNSQGRLIRTLWALKNIQAGRQETIWDGNDGLGAIAPPDQYTLKVVVNHGKYTNIGTIGNTASPPDSFHHVPINFEDIATDNAGNIYTVHDWDEPHHDVICWSPDTGKVLSHSGHPSSEMFNALAVDGDVVYISGYADVKDRTKSRFLIMKLKLRSNPDKPNASNWPVVPFTKAGKQLMVYSGNAEYPPGISEEDRSMMGVPLRSLAVHEQTLYVADALAGKVRLYDKITGEQTGAIDVPLPQTVAVGADGRIWVGHKFTQVSVFDRAGKLLGTPINDLTKVKTVSLGSEGRLYVADQGSGQVRMYDIAGNALNLRSVFGSKAKPGDRAADRFHFLMGATVDKAGNLFTVQREYFFNGGRLAKFAPDGKTQWEQLGLEFSSNGNYSPEDPDTFYSFMEHTYRIDRKNGSWQYLGNSYSGTPYHGENAGSAPRIGRIGKHNFAFMPAGDGVQVYRIEPPTDPEKGPVTKLVAVIGRASPPPTGGKSQESSQVAKQFLWSWHDEQGDHTPQPEEINYWAKPGDGKPVWQFRPVTIDGQKNLWITSADRGGNTPERNSIWTLPMSSPNKLGNPVYEWKNVKRVITEKNLLWPMEMQMAQHADDGRTYVYGVMNEKQPGIPKRGAVWMGGNSLACFKDAQCQWQIVLPAICVSLDVIPGGAGGCIIGGQPWKGVIHHYSSEGLLIGSVGPAPDIMGTAPNNPSGLLDMFAAVTVNRDPRDGIIDVFVEDNYNLRIAWYRIDDRDIETITQAVQR